MNRNINATMEQIFKQLQIRVEDDDQTRIANVKRHINPDGDCKETIEFVKRSEMTAKRFGLFSIFVITYKEQRYILVPEICDKSLIRLGLKPVQDLPICQGSGMLVFASQQWPVSDRIKSLDLINDCLGIEEENIVFQFDEIRKFFLPYVVYELDDSRFCIRYDQDISRLACYILADMETSITENTREYAQELSLLMGSRSIAVSMINSFKSQLLEYSFLQWYQCIEYLFRINSGIAISDEHKINITTAIDIVTENELRITEEENLYRVISNYASQQSIDFFISTMKIHKGDNSDKVRVVSRYIYKLRCNIAHLRYNQEEIIIDVPWEKRIECLAMIVLSIYQKCNEKIVHIGTEKFVWTSI